MIKFENRFDEYAYRVATRNLDPGVEEINDGQWVTIENGNVVVSDGTKKSFLVISSKRAGRDNITMSGKATYLVGHYEVTTDQFDAAQSYADMTPLKVNATGLLTPWDSVADKANQIEAYSLGAPADGFLRIVVC